MKKIISLLVIIAVMIVEVPMTLAAEEQKIDQPDKEVVEQGSVLSSVRDSIGTEGVIFLSAAALSLLAIAASNNNGITTPSHH
jgi:hypothetical protein